MAHVNIFDMSGIKNAGHRMCRTVRGEAILEHAQFLFGGTDFRQSSNVSGSNSVLGGHQKMLSPTPLTRDPYEANKSSGAIHYPLGAGSTNLHTARTSTTSCDYRGRWLSKASGWLCIENNVLEIFDFVIDNLLTAESICFMARGFGTELAVNFNPKPNIYAPDLISVPANFPTQPLLILIALALPVLLIGRNSNSKFDRHPAQTKSQEGHMGLGQHAARPCLGLGLRRARCGSVNCCAASVYCQWGDIWPQANNRNNQHVEENIETL
jgi:hypothetical protein